MKEINNNFERIFLKENAIVMLHAHADDESFLSAGVINEFIERNYNILLIYLATGLIKEEEKTVIRRKELIKALKVLGVKNVDFLEYCESKYTKNGKSLFQQSIKEVSNTIKTILEKRQIKNYTLFSYDKNGGYGNKDHLVVHKVGRLLFKNSSPTSLLFEMTISRDLYLRWLERNRKNVPESYLPKLNYWSAEFGLKNEDINYFYSLNSTQIKLKRKALGKHSSQIKNTEFPLSLTGSDFKKLFSREYFACVDRSIL